MKVEILDKRRRHEKIGSKWLVDQTKEKQRRSIATFASKQSKLYLLTPIFPSNPTISFYFLPLFDFSFVQHMQHLIEPKYCVECLIRFSWQRDFRFLQDSYSDKVHTMSYNHSTQSSPTVSPAIYEP